MAIVNVLLRTPTGPVTGARVTVSLIASADDTLDGHDPALDALLHGGVSALTDATGLTAFALVPNASLEPLNTYYRAVIQGDGRTVMLDFQVPASPAGPFDVYDLLLAEPPDLTAYDWLSDAAPLALGASAVVGDDLAASRGDHVHPQIGMATDAELAAHAATPHGGGGVADADYLVGTAHAGLSAEIVVGPTPGGELGGTWASPTVDATHSGSTHAAAQAAAEATAAAALLAHHHDAAYAALAHAHAGVYEPSGTVATHAALTNAHGIADTAQVALRNAAQTFTLAQTFSGQILAADGTAPLPGYGFASNPALGMRRVSSGILGIVAANYLYFEHPTSGRWAYTSFTENGATGGILYLTALGGSAQVSIGRTAAGSLFIGNPANGQSLGIKQLTELTTIAAAATTDTTIQLPANAIILAVSVRVTVAIPTAATFTVGDSGSAARFSTAAVAVAANSTDPGTKAAAYFNATAVAVRITPDVQPAANTGRVRVTVHYIDIVPSTS